MIHSLLFGPEAVHGPLFGTDDQAAGRYRGRTEDTAVELVLLQYRALLQIQNIKCAVQRAGIDALADDSRRTFDAPLGGIAPHFLATLTIQCIDLLVLAAGHHQLLGDSRRGVERSGPLLGLEGP